MLIKVQSCLDPETRNLDLLVPGCNCPVCPFFRTLNLKSKTINALVLVELQLFEMIGKL